MRSANKFLFVSLVVMSFSLMGLMAYEYREDMTILGGIGMLVFFFLIALFCMFADGRDARRHTSVRRR